MSSKQDTSADSTIEPEYIAVSEAAKEAVWIKKFIAGLGVVPSILDPVNLYCDNNVGFRNTKRSGKTKILSCTRTKDPCNSVN